METDDVITGKNQDKAMERGLGQKQRPCSGCFCHPVKIPFFSLASTHCCCECWLLKAHSCPPSLKNFLWQDVNFLSWVRGAPALLRSSVVAVLCRLGLTVGDSVIEPCSLIAMAMIGPQNHCDLMAALAIKGKVGMIIKAYSRLVNRLCSLGIYGASK